MRVYKFKRVNSKLSHSFYKKRTKFNKLGFHKWRDVVNDIFSKFSYELVNNEDGVVIDNLGYACIMKYPKKVKYSAFGFTGSDKYNFHSDSHMFFPTIFTDMFFSNPFKEWTMDRYFNNYLKDALSENIKKGKKYKFYYTNLKEFLNRKSNDDKHLV